MTRTSFNAGWAVRPKVSLFAELSGPVAPPQPVTLPHDALIGLPRSADSAQGSHTGYFPDGTFEYSKTFEVPEDYRGKRVALEFQGVYRDAMVFVNGDFAGQRPFGYSRFNIRAGSVPADTAQANTIRVDARVHQDSRWYSGAGIYRDTCCSSTELVHIAANGVRITTPDIDAERAVVEVATTVENEAGTPHGDGRHGTVRRRRRPRRRPSTAPVTLQAGSTAVVRQRLYVPNRRCGASDTPHLYSRTDWTARRAGSPRRTPPPSASGRSQLDPCTGLRINGETVKLRGACIHHDNGILGAATIAPRRGATHPAAQGRRVQRHPQRPQPAQPRPCSTPATGSACWSWTRRSTCGPRARSSFDYSLAFPEWWERDVEAMVAKDYNHPSVIMYSIGNEIPETGEPLGRRLGPPDRREDPLPGRHPLHHQRHQRLRLGHR